MRTLENVLLSGIELPGQITDPGLPGLMGGVKGISFYAINHPNVDDKLYRHPFIGDFRDGVPVETPFAGGYFAGGMIWNDPKTPVLFRITVGKGGIWNIPEPRRPKERVITQAEFERRLNELPDTPIRETLVEFRLSGDSPENKIGFRFLPGCLFRSNGDVDWRLISAMSGLEQRLLRGGLELIERHGVWYSSRHPYEAEPALPKPDQPIIPPASEKPADLSAPRRMRLSERVIIDATLAELPPAPPKFEQTI